MKPVKIKWTVAPVPTGHYRTFHKRGWPVGWANDRNRVLISCPDEYSPAKVKTGAHAPLTIKVDVFHNGTMSLRTIRGTSATLADAKARALAFFQDNPDCLRPAA